MNPLLIVIAIALLLWVAWLLIQPKQGTKASNAPRSSPPDSLPVGEEQAVMTDAKDTDATNEVSPDKATLSAPPPPPTPSLENEIQQMLNSGQKIAAIKRVRELKQWGLKEAKDYVEALERHESPPMPTPQIPSEPTPTLRQEVKRLLAAHQKVSAVKLVREETHWPLREAKDYVDAIQDEEFHAMDQAVSNLLSDPALREEVQRLVITHQTFAAVERVRSATGWDVSQAMEYVNGVERDLPSE